MIPDVVRTYCACGCGVWFYQRRKPGRRQLYVNADHYRKVKRQRQAEYRTLLKRNGLSWRKEPFRYPATIGTANPRGESGRWIRSPDPVPTLAHPNPPVSAPSHRTRSSDRYGLQKGPTCQGVRRAPQPVVEDTKMDHKRQRKAPIRTTTPEAQRRKALGLALQELARRIGVSRQTLWRWETGQVPPPLLSRRAWHTALAKAEGVAHRRLG